MRISDWSSDVCSSDLQAVRLQPDTHAVFAASEGLYFRNTADPLHTGNEVDLYIVLNKGFVVQAVFRSQGHEHQEAVLLLLRGYTSLDYLLRNFVARFGNAVLHVHCSHVRVSTLLEKYVQGQGRSAERRVGKECVSTFSYRW